MLSDICCLQAFMHLLFMQACFLASQGRRKQLRIGGADRAALRRKFLFINIHEEGVFHNFTRIKMAVRLVFAVSVCSSSLSFYCYFQSAAAISILLLRLLCSKSYTRNLGGALVK